MTETEVKQEPTGRKSADRGAPLVGHLPARLVSSRSSRSQVSLNRRTETIRAHRGIQAASNNLEKQEPSEYEASTSFIRGLTHLVHVVVM